ncbi:hypothetical protein TIFTF001_006548 [Ficus carica]|uniref:Uncharacterized protein n=1 Tax=Ficus carica TaxID=3494 RepID=A0AA88DFT0_FICCA|nr:hypothetical protein TIFTF001_006548 [Ficus carica]
MARIILLLYFSLALLVATAKGSEDSPTSITNQIHNLRPRFAAGGRHVDGLSCLSWRVAVETNNIIGWKTIPTACEGYVGHYMLGKEYRKDSQMVTDEAILYAKSLNISKDGEDF